MLTCHVAQTGCLARAGGGEAEGVGGGYFHGFISDLDIRLQRITGIYRYSFTKRRYYSQILVILEIRGEFVPVCKFDSRGSRVSTRI